MLLTVDVGNTNMVFGLFEQDKLVGNFRLRTTTDTTSDELGILASEYFYRFGYQPLDVEAVIIASVVPQIMYSLNSAMIKYFDKTPIVVDVDVDSGMQYHKSLFQSNERLGTDRSVTNIAAIAKYGAPLIVIDFGTATTVDAIDRDGSYLGGTIGTGLRVTMDALIKGTAVLPMVELSMPEKIIGTSTVGQLQAGVVAGYVGNMEYLITRMKQEMNCDPIRVVATGGLSRLISENSAMIDVVDRNLTMDGLRMIYETIRK
ncbi:MAG: type III pantothenate kinase [Eubacteriales bacterium]